MGRTVQEAVLCTCDAQCYLQLAGLAMVAGERWARGPRLRSWQEDAAYARKAELLRLSPCTHGGGCFIQAWRAFIGFFALMAAQQAQEAQWAQEGRWSA